MLSRRALQVLTRTDVEPARSVGILAQSETLLAIVCRLRRRSRGETVPAHDLAHARTVRRTFSSRLQDLRDLTEIEWTDGGWGDDAERLRVRRTVVVEAV